MFFDETDGAVGFVVGFFDFLFVGVVGSDDAKTERVGVGCGLWCIVILVIGCHFFLLFCLFFLGCCVYLPERVCWCGLI